VISVSRQYKISLRTNNPLVLAPVNMTALLNQNPEQIARDAIDKQLTACGWIIQNKNQINLSARIGVAVREYGTDIEPADYVLFADKKPVGIIEAKRAEEGARLTMHEEQSEGYAAAKLKYIVQHHKLPFVYESTEETNPNEYKVKETAPVARNEKVLIEFFDFIVIDECHCSIYNLWKQVLDYFDVSFVILLLYRTNNKSSNK